MQASSLKQRRLMQAAGHNPEFAEKGNIPQPVGREASQVGMGMMPDHRKMKVRKIADALKRGH